MHNINNKQTGQGLIEVIVAIFIIVSGISGAVTLTYSNLRSNESSITQIIGANLAREGVEVVRNLRDENWLVGSNWLVGVKGPTNDFDGILDFNPSTAIWTIDFSKNGISSGRLYLDSDGIYNHTTGTITPYWRIVDIKVIRCQNKSDPTVFQDRNGECANYVVWIPIGIKVRSEVQWQENRGTKSYKIEENLYNWHDAN